MKENAEIRFKLTSEQHDKIKSKAESVGMTLKGYLIYLGLNVEPEISIK